MKTKKREKPKHLGRGLQSLLGPITEQSNMAELDSAIEAGVGNFPPDKELQNALREVSISSVLANPYQPRASWDQTGLAELADSIRANGVVQPIVVRPSQGGYELIAGERRLRAAREAGLETIPALVRKASDEQLLELALVENIHRVDLNPIERARAYQKYIDTFGLTQAQAAERLGENRSVIANYLRLLELPDEIKRLLKTGQMSMGHARAILALPTDELKRKLANRAMAGRLSVREVERLVRLYMEGEKKSKQKPKSKPPHIAELETMLGRHLGTKVSIVTRKGGRQGKIEIDFTSLDEFDRIAEQMGMEISRQV